MEYCLSVFLISHCQCLIIENGSSLFAAEIVSLSLAERSHSCVYLERVHLSVIIYQYLVLKYKKILTTISRNKGTHLWIRSQLGYLLFQLKDLLSQGVVLFGIGHILLTCPHYFLILFYQEIVVLFQHFYLLFVVILHLDTHVLTSIKDILVLSVHLQL